MRIGVDIGGTKTEVVALTDEGHIIVRRREPTPHGTYDQALHTLAALVLDVEKAVGRCCPVGIGTPGFLDQETGVLCNAFATAFNQQPLKPDLERVLAREIRFANDANCFALSEAADGAARGAAVVFGVILGTGVGGGIVVDGKIIAGANGAAGEWGHNPLPWATPDERPGPRCGCTRLGCIEAFLSGPGLARDHEQSCGEPLSPAAVVEGAATGVATCLASMERYEERLAKALAHIMNVIDPDVIVLGGGLSSIARLYSGVPARWGRYAYSRSLKTRLVRNLHGDAGGVRGAAWLWSAGVEGAALAR